MVFNRIALGRPHEKMRFEPSLERGVGIREIPSGVRKFHHCPWVTAYVLSVSLSRARPNVFMSFLMILGSQK